MFERHSTAQHKSTDDRLFEIIVAMQFQSISVAVYCVPRSVAARHPIATRAQSNIIYIIPHSGNFRESIVYFV